MSLPPMKTGGPLGPINPQTFEDVQRMARMAVVAGLSPRDRKDDDERAIAKATMAIMQGLECGIPPMQAVQNIAIINGKAMMYGDLLTALLWSRGFKIKKWIEGEGDARIGRATITRPDGEVIEKSFSVNQAKKARLWDVRETIKKQWDGKWEEKPNDSPWFRFADRMLEWRAFGFAVKDGASDATHGMLVREEADPDFNSMIDVTPAPSGKQPLLDIPDIPEDLPQVSEAVESQEAPQEVEDDAPIVDVEGWLLKLEEDIHLCDSSEDLDAVARDNEAIIKRLPKDAQKRANALIKEAAE